LANRHSPILYAAKIISNWSRRIRPIRRGIRSSRVRVDRGSPAPSIKLTFDHTGFPGDMREHLEAGWQKMHFEPLRKYLGWGDFRRHGRRFAATTAADPQPCGVILAMRT
jgi:hypothetical protein